MGRVFQKREKVGIKDDFFRIGGNSILAIQFANKISKKTGAKIKVTDIFKLKDITSLAGYADISDQEGEEIEL